MCVCVCVCVSPYWVFSGRLKGPTQTYALNSCSFQDQRNTLGSNPEVCAKLLLLPRWTQYARFQPRSMRRTRSTVDLPVSAEINAKTWVQRRRMRKTLAHFKINAIRSGPTQKYAQNSCSFQDDSFFRSYRPCPFLLGFTGFD